MKAKKADAKGVRFFISRENFGAYASLADLPHRGDGGVHLLLGC